MNEPIVSFDIDGGAEETVNNDDNDSIIARVVHVHLNPLQYNALCAIDETINQFDYPLDISNAPTHIYMYQTKSGMSANFYKLGTIESAVTLCAAGAITAGSLVCLAASGKVQTVPETAGTYQIIGIALTAASSDGDAVSVQTLKPVEKVVTE